MPGIKTLFALSLSVPLAFAACDNSNPGTADMQPAVVFPLPGATCTPPTGELAACTCSPLDYAPRDQQSRNDAWPACISDQGTYKLLGMSTPAAASRVAAFESMGARLWKKGSAPTPDDFRQARVDYAVAEGIGSRVARRQDIHYPEFSEDKFACSDPATAAAHPDRCAGPGRLAPIINDAFEQGTNGTTPLIQAARLEAALLWFFYISSLSEGWTSTFDDIEDVDSMAGYYNGAQQRDQRQGLSSYVYALSPATHDRIFDAFLGARCWRDLDPAFPAKRLDMYQAISGQADRALTRGMALILADRIGKVTTGATDVQAAQLAFVKVLGGLLDRAVRAADPAKADALKANLAAATPDKVDIKAAQDILQKAFPCA